MPGTLRPSLLALLFGGLLVLSACSSEPTPEVRLALVENPMGTGEVSGRWLYSLEVTRPALARLAFVDLRHPDDGIELELAVEPGAPAELSVRLPNSPGGWDSAAERPVLDYELHLRQGGQQAATDGQLPPSWLPERSLGAPGPVTRSRTLADGSIDSALDVPLVLVAWAYAASVPATGEGIGFLSPGDPAGPGEPFHVPETILHGRPMPLAEYEGALWQLRLRVEPR